MIPFVLRLNRIFHNCINYIIFSSGTAACSIKNLILTISFQGRDYRREMKADQEYAWSALMFYLFYPIAKETSPCHQRKCDKRNVPLTHLPEEVFVFGT